MRYKMIIKTQTVETIRYALRFLHGVNDTISIISESSIRRQKALEDMKKDEDALEDFEQLLRSFGEGNKEDGERVYFYL